MTDPWTPLDAPTCPLCGRANGCAVSAGGSFDTPCWCRTVSIDAAALARVPPALQGRACLCRDCATGATGPALQPRPQPDA